jgi:hypothetical protein
MARMETQPNRQKSDYNERNIDDDFGWIERIGKPAYDLVSNRRDDDFIIKTTDPVLLEYIELSIEQYLDAMPTNLRVAFQQLLDDIKSRKEDLKIPQSGL